MDNSYDYSHQLRALALRVAALEDNVAFLERWCEEQQDILDRAAGPVPFDYEREPRNVLRIVDLRESAGDGDDDDDEPEPGPGEDPDTIVAVVDTDADGPVGQIQDRLNRLRRRLSARPASRIAP